MTPTIWQHYQDTGDPQVATHLASCASCRADAEQFACLQASLAALPVQEVTGEVAARMQLLADTVQEHTLTCTQVNAIIDPWLEGELDPAQSFLLEDHLLWCHPCAVEVDRAEALMIALRELPQLTAPQAIAERLEQARIPWWKKLLPAPVPVWTRQVGWATGLAALFMLAFASTRVPVNVVNTPKANAPIAQAGFVDPTEPFGPERPEVEPTQETAPAVAPVQRTKRTSVQKPKIVESTPDNGKNSKNGKNGNTARETLTNSIEKPDDKGNDALPTIAKKPSETKYSARDNFYATDPNLLADAGKNGPSDLN